MSERHLDQITGFSEVAQAEELQEVQEMEKNMNKHILQMSIHCYILR